MLKCVRCERDQREFAPKIMSGCKVPILLQRNVADDLRTVPHAEYYSPSRRRTPAGSAPFQWKPPQGFWRSVQGQWGRQNGTPRPAAYSPDPALLRSAHDVGGQQPLRSNDQGGATATGNAHEGGRLVRRQDGSDTSAPPQSHAHGPDARDAAPHHFFGPRTLGHPDDAACAPHLPRGSHSWCPEIRSLQRQLETRRISRGYDCWYSGPHGDAVAHRSRPYATPQRRPPRLFYLVDPLTRTIRPTELGHQRLAYAACLTPVLPNGVPNETQIVRLNTAEYGHVPPKGPLPVLLGDRGLLPSSFSCADGKTTDFRSPKPCINENADLYPSSSPVWAETPSTSPGPIPIAVRTCVADIKLPTTSASGRNSTAQSDDVDDGSVSLLKRIHAIERCFGDCVSLRPQRLALGRHKPGTWDPVLTSRGYMLWVDWDTGHVTATAPARVDDDNDGRRTHGTQLKVPKAFRLAIVLAELMETPFRQRQFGLLERTTRVAGCPGWSQVRSPLLVATEAARHGRTGLVGTHAWVLTVSAAGDVIYYNLQTAVVYTSIEGRSRFSRFSPYRLFQLARDCDQARAIPPDPIVGTVPSASSSPRPMVMSQTTGHDGRAVEQFTTPPVPLCEAATYCEREIVQVLRRLSEEGIIRPQLVTVLRDVLVLSAEVHLRAFGTPDTPQDVSQRQKQQDAGSSQVPACLMMHRHVGLLGVWLKSLDTVWNCVVSQRATHVPTADIIVPRRNTVDLGPRFRHLAETRDPPSSGTDFDGVCAYLTTLWSAVHAKGGASHGAVPIPTAIVKSRPPGATDQPPFQGVWYRHNGGQTTGVSSGERMSTLSIPKAGPEEIRPLVEAFLREYLFYMVQALHQWQCEIVTDDNASDDVVKPYQETVGIGETRLGYDNQQQSYGHHNVNETPGRNQGVVPNGTICWDGSVSVTHGLHSFVHPYREPRYDQRSHPTEQGGGGGQGVQGGYYPAGRLRQDYPGERQPSRSPDLTGRVFPPPRPRYDYRYRSTTTFGHAAWRTQPPVVSIGGGSRMHRSERGQEEVVGVHHGLYCQGVASSMRPSCS